MMNANVATQPVVHSTKDTWAGNKLVTRQERSCERRVDERQTLGRQKFPKNVAGINVFPGQDATEAYR